MMTRPCRTHRAARSGSTGTTSPFVGSRSPCEPTETTRDLASRARGKDPLAIASNPTRRFFTGKQGQSLRISKLTKPGETGTSAMRSTA